MGKMLHEWEIAKKELIENRDNNEWAIIINLLGKLGPGLLSHICRKMIKYLFLLNIPEKWEILHQSE